MFTAIVCGVFFVAGCQSGGPGMIGQNQPGGWGQGYANAPPSNQGWWNSLESSTGQQYQAPNTTPWWQSGANQNGLATNDPRQVPQLQQQVQNLNQRLGQFDNLNSGMEAQVASLQQKLQVATDYNYQLRQQLADSAVQIQQLQLAKQQAEQKVASAENQIREVTARANSGIQVPSQTTGAPTIRANNSLMGKLPNLQIGGVHAKMDGDVIRVEIPSDPLFVQNTFRIQASHQNMLSQLGQAIRQHFPRQVVGVEAHWDNTPIQSATHHQLTATQALAVFDYLKQLGVPERQMFTMAMGSNRSKYQTASGQDRRIDIVIYPETYE